MGKAKESMLLVRSSRRLSVLESQNDALETELDTLGAPVTPKGRMSSHGKTKNGGVRSNYHLRNRVVVITKQILVEKWFSCRKKKRSTRLMIPMWGSITLP